MFRFVLVAAVLLAAAVQAVPVRESAPRGLVKQLFDTVDTDGNGAITAAELSAYSFRLDRDSSASPALAQQMMEMIDASGDGVLSEEELCAMASDKCDDEAENGEDAAPQQVHLAPGPSADSMVVSWVSLGKTARAAVGSVVFGNHQRNTSTTVTATSTTYDCGTPTWTGESFHATLTGLLPSTTYWYRVDTGASASSTEMSFTTADATVPAAGLRYAVFGDMGTIIPLGWKVAKQLTRLNAANGFDSMIHVGDIAYAGVSSEKAKEKPFIWDLFMRQMAPVASVIPYITTVGNHEKYCNYSSFQARFTMPGNSQEGGNGNFWFSVDRGLVHWISMSTEHDYTPESPQGKFLAADLAKAAANRHNVPWIVLTGHRPMYSSDTDETEQHWPGAHLQTVIEPLLRQYNVDLYVGGHMHCYERTHPIVTNGTIDSASIQGNIYTNPKGTVNVVQGTAGTFQVEKWVSPKPEWSAARMQFYGIGDVFVHNSTHLQYTFREQKDDKAVDEFWIVKTTAPAF